MCFFLKRSFIQQDMAGLFSSFFSKRKYYTSQVTHNLVKGSDIEFFDAYFESEKVIGLEAPFVENQGKTILYSSFLAAHCIRTYENILGISEPRSFEIFDYYLKKLKFPLFDPKMTVVVFKSARIAFDIDTDFGYMLVGGKLSAEIDRYNYVKDCLAEGVSTAVMFSLATKLPELIVEWDKNLNSEKDKEVIRSFSVLFNQEDI